MERSGAQSKYRAHRRGWAPLINKPALPGFRAVKIGGGGQNRFTEFKSGHRPPRRFYSCLFRSFGSPGFAPDTFVSQGTGEIQGNNKFTHEPPLTQEKPELPLAADRRKQKGDPSARGRAF
eukprot:FR741976.1.p2 GENE.FR741976.1~~FR741976.1.p2  ORF type:complete len:121 (-),score=17.06 FR741976.1:552-914(-)